MNEERGRVFLSLTTQQIHYDTHYNYVWFLNNRNHNECSTHFISDMIKGNESHVAMQQITFLKFKQLIICNLWKLIHVWLNNVVNKYATLSEGELIGCRRYCFWDIGIEKEVKFLCFTLFFSPDKIVHYSVTRHQIPVVFASKSSILKLLHCGSPLSRPPVRFIQMKGPLWGLPNQSLELLEWPGQ